MSKRHVIIVMATGVLLTACASVRGWWERRNLGTLLVRTHLQPGMGGCSGEEELAIDRRGQVFLRTDFDWFSHGSVATRRMSADELRTLRRGIVASVRRSRDPGESVLSTDPACQRVIEARVDGEWRVLSGWSIQSLVDEYAGLNAWSATSWDYSLGVDCKRANDSRCSVIRSVREVCSETLRALDRGAFTAGVEGSRKRSKAPWTVFVVSPAPLEARDRFRACAKDVLDRMPETLTRSIRIIQSAAFPILPRKPHG